MVFLTILGLLVAVFFPLLQINGVDVNWQESLVFYIVIFAMCSWSFLRHAIPDRKRKGDRIQGMLLILFVVGGLGTYAINKQYTREHTDDLNEVHIVGITAERQKVNSEPVFRVDIENLSNKYLKTNIICGVDKPLIPLKPFGILPEDTTKERNFENGIFQGMDQAEKSYRGANAIQQDLPTQQTVHAYCTANWRLTEEEINKLEHGDITLYVAGRIMVPSKITGAHVDFDFCESGDQNHGMQNCLDHNFPHVHR